jgi:hypothetical protein
MINVLYGWIGKHTVGLFIFVLLLSCGATIYSLVDIVRKPPDLTNVKGIQHRLVWDINGNCFFVRPYNESTNYLIAVADCGKAPVVVVKKESPENKQGNK